MGLMWMIDPCPDHTSVIIILPDLIGTTICSLPAVRQIYKHFQNAQIKIIGFQNVAEILTDEDFAEDIILLNPQQVTESLENLLKRSKINVIFDFLSSRETGQCLVSSGITYRIGRDHYNLRAYNHPVAFSNKINQKVVFDYLDYLSPFELTPKCSSPVIRVSEKTKEEAVDWSNNKRIDLAYPIFILGTGGGNKKKRWPIENYINISRLLTDRYKGQTIFITGPKDIEIHNYLNKLDSHLFLAHSLPLHLLKGIISLATMSICNDYAIMHVSGALGVPTIGVFLSSNPQEWFVYNAPSFYVVGQDIPCRPCYSDNCDNWKCNDNMLFDMVRIGIEKVIGL